ncbi:MAG: hypothetical protein HRU09_13970 [Oligoflexales bacterium]|nr:hypothetical protein [Oligoflexales bacterium]
MDSTPIVVDLSSSHQCKASWVGAKAAAVAHLIRHKYPVPFGFCLTVAAYELFLKQNQLDELIAIELGRKNLVDMRWEELWDSALRIRLAFQNSPVPEEVSNGIFEAMRAYDRTSQWAIRSSAPGEDSKGSSFAGLHETILGVSSEDEVLNAVKKVWASLWSDSALLYRQELSLDPRTSQMAVLIQAMCLEDVSGVAFSEDPRGRYLSCAIIEAVRGACAQLVDGALDPNRWILKKPNGEIIHFQQSSEQDTHDDRSLNHHDLIHLLNIIMELEGLMGCPQDLEWTGRKDSLTILQSRPITTLESKPGDKRPWYLSLKPGDETLSKLADEVVNDLIPRLRDEGEQLACEDLQGLDDHELSKALAKRSQKNQFWKQVYYDKFIPFAHGVRRFGVFYNDHLSPKDPYEFLELLKGESMIALNRNKSLAELANQLNLSRPLCEEVINLVNKKSDHKLESTLKEIPGGEKFLRDFKSYLAQYMDVIYAGESLKSKPINVLKTILEHRLLKSDTTDKPLNRSLEEHFFCALPAEQKSLGQTLLGLARQSWRLRDDDNLLVGRIESQLQRAIKESLVRLGVDCSADLPLKEPESLVTPMMKALGVAPEEREVPQVSWVTDTRTGDPKHHQQIGRQLTGQPAAAGLAKGSARLIESADDLGEFRVGEVLICDAIQPMMTQLVPLASAIVERRGGMLIHGAIIARELGLPCVNGISDIMSQVKNGDSVSVDGYLGIVTIGSAEFDLEWANAEPG